MATLISNIKKISEIAYLANKLQATKLSIVQELMKIKTKEEQCKSNPNLIMESLMIEYYTSNAKKRIEMAEESIFLADEVENNLRRHTFK